MSSAPLAAVGPGENEAFATMRALLDSVTRDELERRRN
jgi:hypothetical protein